MPSGGLRLANLAADAARFLLRDPAPFCYASALQTGYEKMAEAVWQAQLRVPSRD
jgi:hypothetical protein